MPYHYDFVTLRRAEPNRIGGLTIIDQVVVLNNSHKLTEQSRHRLAAMCDARECLELGLPGLRQLDLAGDIPAQVRAAVDALGWSTRQWQTTSFVVVLPALSLLATILTAEVHGRAGHFPLVVQIRGRGTTPEARRSVGARRLDIRSVPSTQRASSERAPGAHARPGARQRARWWRRRLPTRVGGLRAPR